MTNEDFLLYVQRQQMARVYARWEVYKLAQHVKGSIVECGVFNGFGMFGWAFPRVILSERDYYKTIVGFDTFGGFPSLNEKDDAGQVNAELVEGAFNADMATIQRAIVAFDENRAINHIPMLELVQGDFMETGPKYLSDNPHFLVSLLYLDFDLYEPTKKALEIFLPRMPKGAVLCFDEVHNKRWPGETLALLEACNLRDIELRGFEWEPNISWAVI